MTTYVLKGKEQLVILPLSSRVGAKPDLVRKDLLKEAGLGRISLVDYNGEIGKERFYIWADGSKSSNVW